MKTSLEKLKWFLFVLAIFFGVALFTLGNQFLIPQIGEKYFFVKINQSMYNDSTLISSIDKAKLIREVETLKRKNERLTPGSSFLIINTTDNTFRLYKNNQVIRSGKCSTGSFIQLEVDSVKSYTFETHKGALTVKGKITNPIWKKPEWAFIEEG